MHIQISKLIKCKFILQLNVDPLRTSCSLSTGADGAFFPKLHVPGLAAGALQEGFPQPPWLRTVCNYRVSYFRELQRELHNRTFLSTPVDGRKIHQGHYPKSLALSQGACKSQIAELWRAAGYEVPWDGFADLYFIIFFLSLKIMGKTNWLM